MMGIPNLMPLLHRRRKPKHVEISADKQRPSEPRETAAANCFQGESLSDFRKAVHCVIGSGVENDCMPLLRQGFTKANTKPFPASLDQQLVDD
jgi:hypothetical protein